MERIGVNLKVVCKTKGEMGRDPSSKQNKPSN